MPPDLHNALEEALAVVSVISSLDFEFSSDVFEEGPINCLAHSAKVLIEKALNILDSGSKVEANN
ncbi:MAG: hypothetical protein RMI30_00410 [Thermodesulfovibrio sp.]|nr:hypothetical protein [Thermodesulfovibrio sp.]MDW7997904.1 hypothetical protein [Thermodesulfovibrio sp.]